MNAIFARNWVTTQTLEIMMHLLLRVRG